jgi:kynurenine formamidase
MNLLTPDKVMQGMAEVKHGITFNLSLPLDFPGGSVLNPRRSPPVLRPTVRNGKPNMNYQLWCDDPLCTDVISDDLVVMHLQYSTQWDSLAHAGSMFDADGDGVPEPLYYNGFRAGVDVVGPDKADGAGIFDFINIPKTSTSYAKALGIEVMAERCVQGRAVMVDLHANLGHTGEAVGYDTWMRILEKDRIEIESGDMVCIHTGFGEVLLQMNRQPDAGVLARTGCALDGRDEKLKQWITDSGLIALIADNYAVETHPAVPGDGACASLPLHEHCLFKLGVHLGELWHLTPLANWLRAHQRHRFLLTAPPLRLPGAIGSPAAPIATV